MKRLYTYKTDKELKAEAQYDMAREEGLISPVLNKEIKKRGIKINWSRDKSKLKLKKIAVPDGAKPKHG